MKSEMSAHANLISDSLLVLETIDYLVSVGGAAPATRLVDYVMNISEASDDIACRLMEAIVSRDGRLSLNGNVIELSEPDHDAIDLCETSFVVFDLETTGAKAPPCRITEIGAFKVENCEVVGEFQTLLNPEVPIPPFITALTGISDAMVADAPRFAEVVDDFLEFIGDSVLVAHNSPFDLGFLNHEISMVHEDCRVGNPALCTVQLSRRLLPDIENHKLKTVASYYSVDLINHHRASDDAHATARIFINLLKMLDEQGIKNLGAARKFSQRRHYARRKVAA
jgi:DNA polymerase III epsilon subunit family exonuclease